MAKTKLNESNRNVLRALAAQLVVTPKEDRAQTIAYEAAASAVRADVTKAFPPADMKTLHRYQAAVAKEKLLISDGNGTHLDYFDFADHPPLIPAGRHQPCLVSAQTYQLFEAWRDAREAKNAARKTKLDDYYALIRASYNFEDVLDVWAEAEQARAQICTGGKALSVVTPDLAKRIRADVRTRTKAGV